jgi:hypothetical protein
LKRGGGRGEGGGHTVGVKRSLGPGSIPRPARAGRQDDDNEEGGAASSCNRVRTLRAPRRRRAAVLVNNTTCSLKAPPFVPFPSRNKWRSACPDTVVSPTCANSRREQGRSQRCKEQQGRRSCFANQRTVARGARQESQTGASSSPFLRSGRRGRRGRSGAAASGSERELVEREGEGW